VITQEINRIVPRMAHVKTRLNTANHHCLHGQLINNLFCVASIVFPLLNHCLLPPLPFKRPLNRFSPPPLQPPPPSIVHLHPVILLSGALQTCSTSSHLANVVVAASVAARTDLHFVGTTDRESHGHGTILVRPPRRRRRGQRQRSRGAGGSGCRRRSCGRTGRDCSICGGGGGRRTSCCSGCPSDGTTTTTIAAAAAAAAAIRTAGGAGRQRGAATGAAVSHSGVLWRGGRRRP